MSYELYYMPTTASLSVHWVLVHLKLHHNISFKTHLVAFPSKDQRKPSYLDLNPKGRVPTLKLSSGEVLTESTAILLYLAEQHPEANLSPFIGSSRRLAYLETMVYIANTILPSLRDYIYAGKDGPGGQAAEAVKELNKKKLDDAWELLNDQMEGKEYLAGGEEPSVVDFLLVSVTGWMKWIRDDVTSKKNLKGLVERMEGRDDWVEVRKREDEVEAAL